MDSEPQKQDRKSKKRHFDLLHRIILIGDKAVGKTCLLVRYFEGKYQEQ